MLVLQLLFEARILTLEGWGVCQDNLSVFICALIFRKLLLSVNPIYKISDRTTNQLTCNIYQKKSGSATSRTTKAFANLL